MTAITSEASETANRADPSGGAAVIRAHLKTMPNRPGVYRMLNEHGDPLYIGKAKNLRKRVVAYTRLEQLPLRLQRMVALTRSMEIVTTHTEAEALLLESNLIKRLRPTYNILLKDDKSFPHIHLDTGHPFPRVLKHRGAKPKHGELYGPFASAGAVNRSLDTLQKAFLLRTCSDHVFANRTRPCLLYQIKRCSAPCVDRITPEAYAALVGQARGFLTGRSRAIQDDLAARMQEASDRLDFEAAAAYRDRIRALAQVTAHQDVNPAGLVDADVVGMATEGDRACVQVYFIRSGFNNGTRAYFPAQTQDSSTAQTIAAFLGQFYAQRQPPPVILLSHAPERPDLLCDALSLHAGRKVTLRVPKRGPKASVLAHCVRNAQMALAQRMAESTALTKLFEGIATVFDLDAPPSRIEVYDNSHIRGRDPVGGMIVAGLDGFVKNAYRTFSMKTQDLTPGDDYAMLREVLTRRFARAQKEDPDRSRGQWPDLVLIDGGKGQVSSAIRVLEDLGIEDLPLIGISKGPDRDAGREVFHRPDGSSFSLPPRHPVLFHLQRLRDEAHRFAIGAHRSKRGRSDLRSPLDSIPGIGGARKKALLYRFGSARGVAEAGLADLQAVDGISRAMAQRIYDHFHGEA